MSSSVAGRVREVKQACRVRSLPSTVPLAAGVVRQATRAAQQGGSADHLADLTTACADDLALDRLAVQVRGAEQVLDVLRLLGQPGDAGVLDGASRLGRTQTTTGE